MHKCPDCKQKFKEKKDLNKHLNEQHYRDNEDAYENNKGYDDGRPRWAPSEHRLPDGSWGRSSGGHR